MEIGLRYILFFFFLLIPAESLFAQSSKVTFRWCTDSLNGQKKLPVKLPYSFVKTDSVSLLKEQRKMLVQCWDRGYFESFFSLTNGDSNLYCLEKGRQFSGLEIIPENDSTEWFLKASGSSWPFSKTSKGRAVLSNYAGAAHRFLLWAENNGYPFAECGFTEIRETDNHWKGKFYAKTNSPVKIDSIVIKGNAKISKTFFYRSIGIKPGQLYSESKLKKSSRAIKQLDFVREKSGVQVVFTPKYTKLIYVLEPVKANQIDGYLGFLPNDQTGKLEFLGQLKIKLVNAIGKGEMLDLDWRGLPNRSRDLKGKLAFPFVLKTPFGADYGIRIFQRDTLFTDVNQELGINYFLGGLNSIKVFYKNRNNSIVSDRYSAGNTLAGGLGSVRIDAYGLLMRFDGTDDRLYPKKGSRFFISASAGSRKVKKLAGFTDTSLSADSLNKNNLQISFEMSIEKFMKISARNIVLLSAKSSSITGNKIFFNEANRIGGLNSLRGFDEESIYTSSYAMGNIEWRFLLDKSSFLFGFYNMAFYELSLIDNYINDSPRGFGLGINFETKPGIFSLTYALGQQLNNPVSFRAAKIHFGIVSTF